MSDTVPSVRAPGSLWGVSAVMFLSFVGFSASQFHGYLFQRMGYSPMAIGVLLCLGFAAGILAPLAQVKVIGLLRGPRLPMLLLLLGAGIFMAWLPCTHGFYPTLAVFFLCLFCTSGVPPLNTATTLEVTRLRGGWMFFLIRALGSFGFLVGCIVSYFYPRPENLRWLYLGFGGAFLLALLAALLDFRPGMGFSVGEAKEKPGRQRALTLARALRLLSAPKPQRLIWALAVMNFANSMAILVQGNYLATRFAGGQRSISLAWVVSTTCEIPIMLFCAYLSRRFSLRAVLGFGIFGTTLKLVVIGVAETRWMYYAGLAAHGCFFSGALTGMSLYIDQRFPLAHRPTLQALAALLYGGLPAALGGLAAGWIWHRFGLRNVYWASGFLGVAVGIYSLFLLPHLPRNKPA